MDLRLIPYLCLGLAVIGCFWPRLPRLVPLLLTVAACSSALLCDIISMAALPSVAAIAALVGLQQWLRLTRNSAWPANLVLGLLALLLVALSMHKLPGFHNVLLLDQVQVSRDAIPFTLYANFDKGLAGVVLLLVLWPLSQYPAGNWQSAHRGPFAPAQPALRYDQLLWRGFWPLFPLTFLCSELLGVTFGFLTWDPKLPPYTLQFLMVNLFLTCVAEELFFRGLLQTSVQHWLTARGYALWPAAVVVGLLFGVAHLAGGWPYAVAVTFAGIGYGLMYLRSGRIEVAILGHFALNAVHFFLFSYPMLAS